MKNKDYLEGTYAQAVDNVREAIIELCNDIVEAYRLDKLFAWIGSVILWLAFPRGLVK